MCSSWISSSSCACAKHRPEPPFGLTILNPVGRAAGETFCVVVVISAMTQGYWCFFMLGHCRPVLGVNMTTLIRNVTLSILLVLAPVSGVLADEYADAIQAFKGAGQSGELFKTAYGYAVFPTIGKGGLVVGGARGKGQVYEKGKHIGDATMTQITAGLQAGGEAFSEIIFFENKAALDQFTQGNFEFGAQAQAVAITAGASAGASTGGGASASASATQHDAAAAGAYYKGMAVFTVAKGGLMYEASIGGQKFNYKPL